MGTRKQNNPIIDPSPLSQPTPTQQPAPVTDPVQDAGYEDVPRRSPPPLPRDVDRKVEQDDNADPITGAPGSHPVGTGIGAAAAGAAGAAIGSAVPGVGTAIGGVVGAVVGAVAGGYAGKAVAEAVNPTDEDAYWRAEHRNRDYFKADEDYDRDYAPAYRSAIQSYNLAPTRPFNEVEPELQTRWQNERAESRLEWERARRAMKDVYERDRTGEGTRATGTSATTISNPD